MRSVPIKVAHIPGEPGVWIIIFGDMIVFGLMFATFAYYRHDARPLFQASQATLNQSCGLINTLLMLSSSWFVALGMLAARLSRQDATIKCLYAALLCGIGFVVVKIYEYSEKLAAGYVINTDDFFMFYYVFTGIHLLHVLVGTSVLVFLIRNSSRGELDSSRITHLESGATFWHLVDLLWIALFAILYLLK